MRLKTRISIATAVLLTFTVAVTCSVTLYNIWSQGQRNLQDYRQVEIEKTKDRLKDIVDLAYDLIEDSYKISDSVDHDMTITLNELSNLRFDNGKGHFWITNDELPFPTMIMHGVKPEINGKEMRGEQYYVVAGKQGKNVYQERVQKVLEGEEAFVEYYVSESGEGFNKNKLSYSRRFEPMGWVVSSGVSTDSIEEALVVQKGKIREQITTITWITITVAILILTLVLLLVNYYAGSLISVITMASGRLKDLSEGKEVVRIPRVRKDELGDMTDYLNGLMTGFANYSSFARKIGDGDLNTDFEKLSDEDVLGNELLKMRDSLKKSTLESDIRNWMTEGIAKFADILRGEDNLKMLSEKIILNYVKYLNAIQGSIFLLTDEDDNDDEVELMLMATYAYDRHKYLQKRISLSDGLPGQCIRERKTIYLKEVPQEFVYITSGLGGARPNSVLIVPLMLDDKIFGVLEVASFNPFEDHEIEFAEKICQDIASTISSVKTNEKTRTLLEESQEMAQNMSAQEEELRQNQEELQATQEQMKRRQEELVEENESLKAQLGVQASEVE